MDKNASRCTLCTQAASGGGKGRSIGRPPPLDAIRQKDPRNSVIFSLKNQVGGLARALHVFQDLGINVLHIESRPAAKSPPSAGTTPNVGVAGRTDAEFEIMVDVECDNKRMEELMRMLKREVAAINLHQYEAGEEMP